MEIIAEMRGAEFQGRDMDSFEVAADLFSDRIIDTLTAGRGAQQIEHDAPNEPYTVILHRTDTHDVYVQVMAFDQGIFARVDSEDEAVRVVHDYLSAEVRRIQYTIPETGRFVRAACARLAECDDVMRHAIERSDGKFASITHSAHNAPAPRKSGDDDGDN